jgi:hypothetical protein
MRLTDDEIRQLRYYKQACSIYPEMRTKFFGVPLDESVERLLDEIEERRRIDAEISARVDEAWQAGREEEEQKRKDFIAKRNDPELDAVEERASKFWNLDLRGRMERTDEPAGKDGGA